MATINTYFNTKTNKYMTNNKLQITPKQLSVGLTIGILIWGVTSISTHTEPVAEVNEKPQLEILEAKASEIVEVIPEKQTALEIAQEELEIINKQIELEKKKQGLNVEQKVSVATIDTPALQAQAVIEPKTDQRHAIEAYRAKYFPNSPVTTDMIIKASEESGVPAGFILAVGHNESHMGTKGRAVATKNPFNVGNVTAGDNKPTNCNRFSNCLNDWQEGVNAFTSLITRCYFNEGEPIKLQTWIDRDFRAVRCNIAGKRYMTSNRVLPLYQERINNLKTLNIQY